jgi:hypothetical protein
MSDVEDLVVAKRAGIVRRIDSVMNTWGHIVEEGTDWTEALNRDYWSYVVDKLRPGDSVVIHSFDHRIQFAMLVLDCNTSSDPVYLDVAFLPVYPTDLELPQMPAQRQPRYQVRQAPGSSGFRVIDTSSGLPVHDNTKDRYAALEMASQLERGITSSAAQMAATESASQRSTRRRQRAGAA